jgi:hypothetical protein
LSIFMRPCRPRRRLEKSRSSVLRGYVPLKR